MDDATLCREVAVKVMEADGISMAEAGVLIPMNWSTAGMVIEKMRAQGWVWKFQITSCRSVDQTVYVEMYHSDTGEEVETESDSFPRAVLKAALAAMESAKEAKP